MESNKKTTWYTILPIILIISVVPLIVKLKVIELEGPALNAWTGQSKNFDFFSYYKMFFFLIFVGMLILVTILSKYRKEFYFKKTYVYIPIVIYTILLIFSTIFSEYRNISMFGFPDRYEGMLVLLGYMITLFLTINIVNEEKQIKYILSFLLISSVIMSLIGIFQYFGYDLFKSDFGKTLILNSEFKDKKNLLNFTFGKRWIYSTLYNTNYIGSYMAMLVPMSISICILSKSKKIKLTTGIISILFIFNLIGSNSRAGIVGVAISLIVFLVSINKYIFKHWKQTICLAIICIILFSGINKVLNGNITRSISTLNNDMKSFLNQNIDSTQNIDKYKNIALKGIEANNNTGKIITKTETLLFEIDNNSITFRDENDKILIAQLNQENSTIEIKDERYKEYSINLLKSDNVNILKINKNKDGILLFFALYENRVKLIDTRGNDIFNEPVEHIGFQGKERIGSSRGYIWSRAIPLLKDVKIIGYGPDVFPLVFPQYEFIEKLYAYFGQMWLITDKPHNFYLQTAISTGIISLIALLILFITYIITSIKLFIKNSYEDFYSIVGVSIFVAVIGYLVSAVFNDSVVSVAPVFWVLLGMGISVNLKLKNAKSTK